MIAKSYFAAVLDTLEEGLLLLDARGRVQRANAAALGFLGYPEEELLGKDFSDIFSDTELSSSPQSLLESGRPRRGKRGSLIGKDVTATSVSYFFDPLPAAEGGGAVLRFQAPACDLALRDLDIELRAILDTIVDGFVAADEHGLVRLFNPAAERLFGYRAEEVIGQNVSLLMPSPDHEAHDGYIANYLRTGEKKIIGIGREVTGKRKDGSLFPLHLSIGDAVQAGRRLFVAVIHDLTSRKRVEEKLLILSSVVEQSPNAVLIANLEGVIEYVNSSFTKLTGYTSEESVGKKPSLLRSPHTLKEQYQRLWEDLSHGQIWQEEIQDRKKDGTLYWALETISPLRNNSGAVTHYLAIQQDITGQKRDKMALQESEERFRQTAEMTGEWLWEQDPEGRYLYSSVAVRQILGYEPAEILGKRYLDLLTDDDKKHWLSELPPTQDVHESFCRLVNRYKHKNGQEVFTESTGEPIFDANGKLIKWRGVDHDITGRKRYEDALRLRDRAIEAASVGINICASRESHYPNIYVNPALSRITGYSREELLGRNMRLLQGPDTDRASVDEIARALREERGCELILKNYRKNGEPFWNELLIAPVRDEVGKLTHYIGIQNDVTELRRAEEERHELEIAKQIQLSLLPKGPLRLDGVEVAGICLPANQVGGDYFDYFFTPDHLDIVIADVSGHSVGAALIMAEARSALKAETYNSPATQSQHTAAMILRKLNQVLHDDLNGADLFITMFYLRYDRSSRELGFANAGHNWPLMIHQNERSCRKLDAEGMIFGVRQEVEFEQRSLQLTQGDRLLLYTDGVTEAQNAEGEFFGLSRLCDAFSACRMESPENVIDKLLASLREFCGDQPFADDVTMVVMKIE